MTYIKPFSMENIGFDPLMPTIFHEPWWLTIATGGSYDIVEVLEDGKVVGWLPYYTRKNKIGMSLVDLPPLTHFLGPAIAKCYGKPNTQFLHRHDITKQLIDKLPHKSAFYVKCHRDVTDVLAFQGAGFRTGIQFTHELHPQPIDIVWKSLRDKARNLICAAQKKYSLVVGHDPELFMKFYAQSIEQNKGETNQMEIRTHANLIRACMERGRGKIYEARDRDGKLASAIFCAWDSVASYYLMTCRSPSAHGSCTSLLVWEAIKDAVDRNLIFDFDGVISEGGLRAASNFASVLSPRYTALRETPTMRLFNVAKSFINPGSFYY